MAREHSSPLSRLMRRHSAASSCEPLITKTFAGAHMAMALAIFRRASAVRIAWSFARFAESITRAKSAWASASVLIPPPSARMSTPFLSSSIWLSFSQLPLRLLPPRVNVYAGIDIHDDFRPHVNRRALRVGRRASGAAGGHLLPETARPAAPELAPRTYSSLFPAGVPSVYHIVRPGRVTSARLTQRQRATDQIAPNRPEVRTQRERRRCWAAPKQGGL